MNGKTLKEQLSAGKTVCMPGAFNAFTAKLIEQAGFDGVYVSGAGLSNSLGVADDGSLELEDFSYFADFICKAVKIPVICDADDGFDEGRSLGGVEETVKLYIAAGLAGMHIEDQLYPKRCGHLPGKEVIPQKVMIDKIERAVKVRDKLIRKKPDTDFLIIARTDARGAENIPEAEQLQESIDRGRAYRAAGADMIFPESLRSKEELVRYRADVKGWLLANMTEFGKTPFLTGKQFAELGYNIVIFPVSLFRFSAGKIEAALERLKADGNQQKLVNEMMTRDKINQLLDYKPT